MNGPLLVLAGDRDQYRTYCDENRLDPRRDARYVRGTHDVQGLRSDVRFVCYGTWAERRELAAAFDCLRSRGAIEVDGRPIYLSDVLTADEIRTQAYPADLELDSPWMPYDIRALFRTMPHKQKRAYARSALELATMSVRDPAECLTLLLTQAYAAPRRILLESDHQAGNMEP